MISLTGFSARSFEPLSKRVSQMRDNADSSSSATWAFALGFRNRRFKSFQNILEGQSSHEIVLLIKHENLPSGQDISWC